MIKEYLKWPWLLSVPLLIAGFGLSVFFVGTDSILIGPAYSCLVLFAFIGLLPSLRTGVWEIPKNYTFLFLMLFWLWVVVSITWSTVPYISTMFALILGLLPAYFAIAAMTPHGRKWADTHAFGMWLALGGFAVWALIQFFFLYDEYGPRIKHPMLNPNNLAGLFNLGVFPAMGLFFFCRKRWAVIAAGAALALFYMALIVTQSRGGILSFGISTLVFLPFALWRNPGGFPWQRLLYVAIIAFLLPYVANITHSAGGGPGALEKNLLGDASKSYRSMEDRFYLWQSTWEIIKEHFWFGIGLAAFYFHYPAYRNPLDRSDGFFSHMDPLQFWAEMGIMAPVLFYGILICVFVRTIRALMSKDCDFQARLRIMAPFCGMLALIGHTHITFHLYMPGMLLPLAVLLAYWYKATEIVFGRENEVRTFTLQGKRRWGAVAAVAVLLIVSETWIARAAYATHLTHQVQTLMAKQELKEARDQLDFIGKIAPSSYSRYYEYQARIRLNVLWNNAKNMPKEQVRQFYEEGMDYLKKAQARNTHFTSLWDMEARFYYAVDDILIPDGEEKAVSLLKDVLQANPLSVDSRIGLANIYKSRGELRKALAILEDGTKWPRPKGVPDVKFLLAVANLKKQLGDDQGAQLYMQEAQKRAKGYGLSLSSR